MLSSPANYAPSHLRPCSLWPRNQLRSVITEDAPLASTCLWGGVRQEEEAPREAWSERGKKVYPHVKFFYQMNKHPFDWSAHLMGWAVLYFVCFFFTSQNVFFCSTSLLFFVSKCIHVLAVSQKHVLVNSVSPSSTLHPSHSRISLGRTRGRARESEGERGFLSASPSSLIIFGCSVNPCFCFFKRLICCIFQWLGKLLSAQAAKRWT